MISKTMMGSPWTVLTLLAIVGCTAPTPPIAFSPNSSQGSPTMAVVSKPSPLGTEQTAAATWKVVPVVTGLKHPWGMVWLPDGAMLITERPGQLRLVRNGQLDPLPVAGVPPVLAEGQGGLLDVSLHPRFQENQLVYLTYAHGTTQANRTRVARATFDGRSLRNVQVIFEVSQTKDGGQHFGSRMLWLPDGTLLVTIGDGGNPPVSLGGEFIRKQAQNLRSHLGKIIRLNEDGSIPADNPFVAQPNADPAVWSYGHRNIQGIARNPANGHLWVSEHGARGGDELNWIDRAKNYGWPVVTYSREYFGPEISQERSRPGMVDPRLVWTPAIAPSGLTFYSGDRFPLWQGNLFAGGLVSKDIRRIVLDKQGNVVSQEPLPIGQRVRDVRQGPDGLIYVLTDAENGQLLRLEPQK